MLSKCLASLVCLIGCIVGLKAAEWQAADPTPDQIQDIVKKFTQKETEFAAGRERYTYPQRSKSTETQPPGGSYEIVENVSFDSRNRRTSHVLHAPVASLQNILMTAE